jgi:hypothetical protein
MKSYKLLLVPALFISLISCTKEADESASVSDVSLSSMSGSEDLILARTIQSDEGNWNIKMNAIAAKASTRGSSYPANAMIVKEKRDANGNVLSYAVMYKAPADKNSVDGWLYSEYDSEHHAIINPSARAINCQTCHLAINKGLQ